MFYRGPVSHSQTVSVHRHHPPASHITPLASMVTNNVDMEEANILADFFNLQATKHGPEMIRKLNNIGGLKVSGQESRVLGQKQSEPGPEQRKQIKKK